MEWCVPIEENRISSEIETLRLDIANPWDSTSVFHTTRRSDFFEKHVSLGRLYPVRSRRSRLEKTGDKMRKTTIVLVGIIAVMAMTAAPTTAEQANMDEEGLWPCVEVSLDPVGVAVDPKCLEDKLPPIGDKARH